MTNKRYETKAISTKIVLSAWSGTLQNELSLPENWINCSGVLVGIKPSEWPWWQPADHPWVAMKVCLSPTLPTTWWVYIKVFPQWQTSSWKGKPYPQLADTWANQVSCMYIVSSTKKKKKKHSSSWLGRHVQTSQSHSFRWLCGFAWAPTNSK